MKKTITIISFFISTYISAQNVPAVSPTLVISQVYGGAGCGTAGCSTYKNDFIEIFNASTIPVNLNGYSVQYAAATGTAWQVTNLSNFTLMPGQYFLVAESTGANGINTLPVADVTGTIAMSATAAKVALVNSTTALSGACPSGATIIDLVGYGTTANCFETAKAPAISTTTSAMRAGNGCTDVNNNSTDFTAGAPSPRNSATTVSPCSVVPVTLQKFSVNKSDNSNQLYWQVNCLSSSVTFELQRSADSKNFETIYNSSATKARCVSPFTYSDAAPPDGANYYRLKIVDIDGKISYSKISLAVNNLKGKNVISIQPTIVFEQINLVYASPSAGKVQWVITDMQGRLAKRYLTAVTSGVNKLIVPAGELFKGQYQLKGYTTEGSTGTVKFMKQ